MKNKPNHDILCPQNVKNYLLTMKITFLLLVLSVLNVYATNIFSQNGTISVHMQNATVREVVMEIERQGGISFLFNDNLVGLNRHISVSFNDQPIKHVLESALTQADITYEEIKDDFVVLLSTSDIIQQQRTVSGTVTDEGTGEALPGVAVIVRGTAIGTTTNADGFYRLTIPEGAEFLTFSFVGMLSQEIFIGDQQTINVMMVADLVGLEEVVVVGFGTQRKVNITGSVSTVSSETFESRPVRNVAQMLQGVATGLNIDQSAGGKLKDEASLNIRGVTTIGTGSTGSPLVLIDGMEGHINSLNPQDIESVNILKDAAASSIYGSRAPFGVILITTKQGSVGKPTFRYTNNFRWNVPILLPKQMDSYTFATYFNDASMNGGSAPVFNDVQLKRILDYQAGIINETTIPNPSNPQFWAFDFDPNDNIDWYSTVYRGGAPSMEHSFNVSGGIEDITYYLSGNYLEQKGLMRLTYDDYQRYNLTGRINARLSDWSSITYTVRWARHDLDEPSWGEQTGTPIDRHWGRRAWPTWPLYDPNGYLWQLGRFDFPLGLAEGGRSETQNDRMVQQLHIRLEPVRGLRVSGDLNYQVNDSFNHWYQNVLYNHDVNGNPYVSVPDSRVQVFQEQIILTLKPSALNLS